jgi:hypothetical protein
MLSVERHPNLDNWFEVRVFDRLVDQFTSAVKAIKLAKEIQKEERFDSIYINIKRQDNED